MAGWSCPDREIIEWDGTIKAKTLFQGSSPLNNLYVTKTGTSTLTSATIVAGASSTVWFLADSPFQFGNSPDWEMLYDSGLGELTINNLVASDFRFDGGGNNIYLDNVQLRINTAGYGLWIKEGTNARMGIATLNGTNNVTINTTAVTANSRIFLTPQTSTGLSFGAVTVSGRTPGTSFTIKSTDGTVTDTVAWMIVEPA